MLGAYSVSKTALLGLTKAAAQQCAGDNITVNCVAPGIIKTKFSSAVSSLNDCILRVHGTYTYVLIFHLFIF